MADYEQDLTSHLAEFLTPHRRQRFEQVLDWRTRWITVVVADVYQQHNASAVLRTCDAFGIQDVHVVETYNEFETNPEIALGTDQWLTIHRHGGPDAILACVNQLKAAGFGIVATVPTPLSVPITELSLDRPVALLFGTEKDGLPTDAIAAADESVHLPMYGFVESFNVSVAAALCLQELTARLRGGPFAWKLSPQDRCDLLLDWTRKTIPGAEEIERRFRHTWTLRFSK